MSTDKKKWKMTPAHVLILDAIEHYRFLRLTDVMRLHFPTEPGTTKGKKTRVVTRVVDLVEAEYLGSRPVVLPPDLHDGISSCEVEVYFLKRNGRDVLASNRQIKAHEFDWRSDHQDLGAAEVAHLLLTNDFRITIALAVQRKAAGWQLQQSNLPAALKAAALDLLLRQGYSPQRLTERLEYLLWELQTQPGSIADPVQELRVTIAKPQMAKPPGFSREAITSPFAGSAVTPGYELTGWVTNLQLKRLQNKQKLTSYLGDLYPDYEFGLTFPDGREFHICVEIDRGTENLSNSTQPEKDSSIATKVAKYVDVAFTTRPSIYEQARGRPSDTLRIWFLTTRSPERIANMLETIKQAGGLNRFAVISHHCARPDLILDRPVWQLAQQGPGHYVRALGLSHLDQLTNLLKESQADSAAIEQRHEKVFKQAAAQLAGWKDRGGIPVEVARAIRADRLAEAWLDGLTGEALGAGEPPAVEAP